jgi:prepilin-type N-terminal cleavage/methylation domain-containing protein
MVDIARRRSTLIRHDGGFTVIELLVVLIIIGVLAKITFASLPNLMSHYRLDGAARKLMADIQRVRFRAIAERKCLKIVFGPNGGIPSGSFQVQKGNATVACTSATYGNDVDTGIKKIDQVNFLTVSSSADPVFDTRGAVNTSSTITLTSRYGRSRQVLVESTGRVRIN